MNLRVTTLSFCALALSACASSSKEISTAYISPLQYQSYTCDQISGEMQRISTRVSQLGGSIDDNAEGDAVAMGVGLVLFWPALFFIDGDGPEAQEYARLKGEYDALHQSGVEKNCGLDTKTASEMEIDRRKADHEKRAEERKETLNKTY